MQSMILMMKILCADAGIPNEVDCLRLWTEHYQHSMVQPDLVDEHRRNLDALSDKVGARQDDQG